MGVTEFTKRYYDEVGAVARAIDLGEIERMVDILADLRADAGRLFILGVGGGAGHASHAVNDFRKICGMEG
jgi:D-sedoheptulose 7-phosphate isomerase